MRASTASLPLLLILAACGSSGGLCPGGNDQENIQQALLQAAPGSTIELCEGTYRFTSGLSLTVNNVTLRGKGMARTLLSFSGQTAGKQGLLVKANGFTVADLTVAETAGDGIKVEGGRDVVFRRVRVLWSTPQSSNNGAYGLYPVQCERVLIEDCEVQGASDAGIYVGQSKTIIVRRNRAQGNVAGIEIENSHDADVHDNTARANTGGILIFDLPGLPMKGGQRVRVFNNQIEGNNTDNFAAEGNTVALVPRGTGMFVMANDRVEFFGNTLRDNKTVSLAVISYVITGLKIEDAQYDPYPEAIYVHDNTFDRGGTEPDPTRELSLALAAWAKVPVPDIIYDGIVDPMKLKEGKVPDDLRLCIRNNRHADPLRSFANIDGEHIRTNPTVTRDLGPHDCAHPALPKIVLPGVAD